jgi:NTE family protein
MKTKIAIACQGGGSHAAFTAGALQTLMENNVQNEFEIMSLSGTSGGALCAALVWYALKKGDNPAEKLAQFWQDNTAQTYMERLFNDSVIGTLELTTRGLLPQFNVSPASPMLEFWRSLTTKTLGLRSRFTDFRALLETHFNFAEITAWGIQPEPPILLLGASNILTGKLTRFNSSREPLIVEHLLASCAIPNLFPAVEIGNNAYWDGLFADNPPLVSVTNPEFIGSSANVPQEIWIIKLNPTRRDSAPITISDIVDRRNELEGNVSIFQSLRTIELINDFLLEGAFDQEFLRRYHVKEPIKIPKSFAEKDNKPYYIPFIEMSTDLQNVLDYESKLDRNPKLINQLIEDGKQQAKKFLKVRPEGISSLN